ncbi:hypothetical protein MHYP_G00279450 [Metynnis hypsauchen]
MGYEGGNHDESDHEHQNYVDVAQNECLQNESGGGDDGQNGKNVDDVLLMELGYESGSGGEYQNGGDGIREEGDSLDDPENGNEHRDRSDGHQNGDENDDGECQHKRSDDGHGNDDENHDVNYYAQHVQDEKNNAVVSHHGDENLREIGGHETSHVWKGECGIQDETYYGSGIQYERNAGEGLEGRSDGDIVVGIVDEFQSDGALVATEFALPGLLAECFECLCSLRSGFGDFTEDGVGLDGL